MVEDTPLHGSAELDAQRQVLINQMAAVSAELRAQEESAFDVELDAATAEVLAKDLVNQKDRNEAQLSHALFLLRNDKAYLDSGYDTFQEYVETRLHFSASKASVLASRWEFFIGVGLAPNVFTGATPVCWNKFAELVPGIKAGIIDDTNIDTWLPYTCMNGQFELPNNSIAKFVKSEILAANAEDDPDRLENFSVRVSTDDKMYMQQYIDTISDATGILGAGEVLRTALEAKVTEIAEDSEDVRKNYGIVRLIDMIKNMVPEANVIFTIPEGIYPDDVLGIVPVTAVFGVMYENGPRFVMATSKEEAAEHFDVDEEALLVFPIEAVDDEEVSEAFDDSGDWEEDDDIPDDEPTEEVSEELNLNSGEDDNWEEVEMVTPKHVELINERPDYKGLRKKDLDEIAREVASELIAEEVIDSDYVNDLKSYLKTKDGMSPTDRSKALVEHLFTCADEKGVELA